MVDWTESMQQTFEYYVVDPGTWKDIKRLDNVKSSSINRDSTVDTLGSATIDTTETLNECYVRIYLVTLQNGLEEKHPLGTFLVQTPSTSFNGKVSTNSMDAYTPLMELKENPPPLGYSIFKDENIMNNAYLLAREHARAPVVKTENSKTLFTDFVANTDDNWLTFIRDLVLNANHEIDLDELGRILFPPKQDMASLQPVWTYNDDNSSILFPDLTLNHDMFNIPNVVEVIYSKGGDNYYAKAVNDDPNSPISTVNRGREIKHRVIDPDMVGDPREGQIQEYANQLLKELSCLEYTITYTHGYCPVRLGDCIRFNYSRAGLNNVKAKVISQNIKCEPGCSVTEKALITNRLWG